MTDNVEKLNQARIGDLSRNAYSMYNIEISDGDLDKLDLFLQQRVDPNLQALKGQAVTLDVSKISHLEALNFEKLKEICFRHSLFLVGLSGITTEDRALILQKRHIPVVNTNRFAKAREENLAPKIITQTLELKVPVEVKVPHEVEVEVPVKIPEPMKIITRTVRSGELIASPNTSVLILGSVGMGARIVASHNIFIFGDLKSGEVYAGNPKDQDDQGYTEAIIYVTGTFDPALVAIAGNYQTAEDLEHESFLNAQNSKRNDVIVSLAGNTLVYTEACKFVVKNKS